MIRDNVSGDDAVSLAHEVQSLDCAWSVTGPNPRTAFPVIVHWVLSPRAAVPFGRSVVWLVEDERGFLPIIR